MCILLILGRGEEGRGEGWKESEKGREGKRMCEREGVRERECV